MAQLDPGSGKTQRAYLWAYRSNDLESGPRIIVFNYQTSRSGRHARDFLDGWQGHLVVDDYAGYKALFTLVGNCTELGCWAHAVKQLVNLVGDLHKHGIQFRSLTASIDTSTPSGRFFFHVMASLAEMERELTVERTRASSVARVGANQR